MHMKKISVQLITGIFFYLATVQAQPACSGIYLTANDFIVGRLYYACASRNTSKESYYDLLAQSHFFIIRPDYAWRRVDKKDVFAIRGCEGQIVRVFQGINYYLLNPDERILIYKALMNPVSKGNIIKVKYGFSIDSVSEIRDLTIDNLKAAFTDNPQFGVAINTNFKDDSDLYSYNKMSKCFELNRVYKAVDCIQ
jgi:hypothetical protein